uniref:Ssr1698 protein n=1 Tax=Synechocystis sp. PCC 6803 TaxID=1148 RepID=UPI0030131EC0
MADPLTPAISDRICKHMNEDHASAIALYAQVFGQQTDVTMAQMQAIDPTGMDLVVESEGGSKTIRIEFEQPLKDSEDAHQVLIAMAKQARSVGKNSAENLYFQ